MKRGDSQKTKDAAALEGSSREAETKNEEAQAKQTAPSGVDAEIAALMQADSGKPVKKKRKWKRIAVIAGMLLVAFLILRSCFAGVQGSSGMSVTTEPLHKGSVQEKLRVSGPVSGTDSADVMSALHAEVKEVLVQEGDVVEQGQPLAYLDTYDAGRAVTMAENQLALARANKEEALKQAQSGYTQAKQALSAAQADHDRKAVLFQAGDIAQAEFEQAKQALANARAALEVYTVRDGQVTVGESYDLQIANAEFELEKAQDNYAQTTVTAPISGTVTRVNTKVGQFADRMDNNDSSMFSIENLSQLELEIKISEYSIGKVSVGQQASISADIMGERTAEGEVIAISPSGEEKGGGSTERVIPTRISVKENAGLIPGITAKAEIVLSEAQDVWVVPISALIVNPDGSTSLAFVKDGVVRMSQVTTGVESDIAIEVAPLDAADPNFTEGSRLITVPNAMLTEGMPVTDTSAQSAEAAVTENDTAAEHAEASEAAETAEAETEAVAETGEDTAVSDSAAAQ